MKVKGIAIVLPLIITFFFMTARVALEKSAQPPTPTEAAGGVIGTGVDELRCPPNLTGIGPTWNEITIGVSSLDDLAKRLGQTGSIATPYPVYAGDFAPNYEFTSDNFGEVYACVVDKKVAALLFDRQELSHSYLPASIAQWVSFLGAPEVVSWHQQANMRMLHWPQFGTSITAYLYEGPKNVADTEWVYLYPFRQADYKNLWPISSIWKIQPFAEERPDIKLEVLDFEVIQATVTAGTLWPSVTPRANGVEDGSPFPTETAVP